MPDSTILITDYAWPDLEIERSVIEGAGFKMAAGPSSPAPVDAITELVRQHQPASILTCWAQVNAAAIEAGTGLRHVGRIGVGLDNIDVAACTARKIPVTNVPDYCVEEVSDHVLALTLAWARGVVHFNSEVHAGRWDPAGAVLRRVADLTVGIVGFGRIGQMTGRKFAAFGCKVLAYNKVDVPAGTGAQQVTLDELLAQSDVVCLHVPFTPETKHLINAERIGRMKRGAFLVNVARGPVVDSLAVAQALRDGQLSGAGLDVLETEPQVPAELLAQPGALLTPHVAFSSTASLAELRRRAAEEAVRVLRGETPQNLCNSLD